MRTEFATCKVREKVFVAESSYCLLWFTLYTCTMSGISLSCSVKLHDSFRQSLLEHMVFHCLVLVENTNNLSPKMVCSTHTHTHRHTHARTHRHTHARTHTPSFLGMFPCRTLGLICAEQESPTCIRWTITHFVSSLLHLKPPFWLLDYCDAAWWPTRKEVTKIGISVWTLRTLYSLP
jgi:hypothetical protein